MKTTALLFQLIFSGQLLAAPRHHFDDLNLTDTQKELMTAVKEKSRQRLNAAREEVRSHALREMTVFLTIEQLAQVEAQMKHRQERHKERNERRKSKRDKFVKRQPCNNSNK